MGRTFRRTHTTTTYLCAPLPCLPALPDAPAPAFTTLPATLPHHHHHTPPPYLCANAHLAHTYTLTTHHLLSSALLHS